MFVAGYGKHSILRFEPRKNYEKRTMGSTGMVIPPVVFKFCFLDFSSLKFHPKYFLINQVVLGYAAVTNNTQISVA